ncbi:MAG: hypothetical protein EAZ99_18575 [Alphaproteobacteria bacterium]|nr:MAG: hypothetical protein EAZ99_18575 [Alphaproteobacteria bacterium]
MPYRATTATGDVLDFRFPLHPETGSPMRVNQLVSQLLATLDRELKLLGEVGNGDVLQAVAMTLAVRAAMIHAPREQTAQLAFELARRALEAGVEAERSSPVSGRA